MSDCFQGVLTGLAAIVGDKHVIASGPDQEPYVVDWRGRYHGRAVAVVKPGSTAQVAAVVRFCAARQLAIVPQGGNAGMCGAATPDDRAGNVVIRLDRIRAVRDVSPLANTITVEAGCILAEVQNAARAVDRYFPLSLGAEGSCQIPPKRADFDPQAPAVAEFLPGFEAVAWHGFFVPAGTPKPIVENLSAEIRAFMRQPETVQKLAELGATAVVVDSEPFAAYIAAETARWEKVVEAANIKLG